MLEVQRKAEARAAAVESARPLLLRVERLAGMLCYWFPERDGPEAAAVGDLFQQAEKSAVEAEGELDEGRLDRALHYALVAASALEAAAEMLPPPKLPGLQREHTIRLMLERAIDAAKRAAALLDVV
ncbi:MAG: hypothetical protein QJR07_20925 [Acetobacteraceae bacterium]|nr:hypothetical protein [Acetobacteraceae bacterium]